jgi:hypothetical protein
VEIRCDAGFRLQPEDGAYADPYCLRTGEWEPARRCVPITCDPYDAPAHGSVQPQGRVEVGGRARIRCDAGYRAHTPRGAAGPAPACLPSGRWEPGSVCVPSHCPPYPPPAHGAVFPAGPVPVGGRAAIECDAGYKLRTPRGGVGPSPGCLPSGEWERGSSCVPDLCPPYPPPPHASVAPDGPVLAGRRVRIRCDRGYVRNPVAGGGPHPPDWGGSETPLCRPGGTYERGMTCRAAPVRCEQLPAPAHGSLWFRGVEYAAAVPAGARGGERARVTCDAHYAVATSEGSEVRWGT